MTQQLSTFLLLALIPAAAEDLQVLQASEGETPPNHMMTAYLDGLADKAFERRTAEREALGTPDEIAAYQESMREFFIDRLGGLPERTPLDARIVDKQTREGYRIEKVIYESRPGMFVTAVMFLPLSDPPYPGVLVPCGHSSNGKACEAYQRACIFLAMNGMAAFIYDPIDQGERYQILDAEGKPRYGGTIGHTMTGVGCILVGTNTAAHRIWDGMRGIDYLVGRPDIDAERIGCTGNSGGGTLTSYLMALDPRIKCAAPSCYLTSFKRLLEEAGPQDAEQNICGQIAQGMDHADYIMMRAPDPTLVCCATQDFFDIRGTWESFREAKRLYTKLGFAERVDLVEAPEKHGFSLLLRQGAVRWMRRWLLGVDDAVTEAEFPVLTDEEIQCTPKGQVMLLEGARSVYDINVEQEKELAKKRKQFWAAASAEEALQKVRELAGIRRLDDLPEPEVEEAGIIEREGYSISKLVLRPEPGIRLPALAFMPPQTDGDAYLYLSGEGKAAGAAAGGPIEKLVREGHLVLAPDLRGTGETSPPGAGGGWQEMFGDGWKDFFRAYLLGRSYVGMRAEDILVCARFLAGYRSSDAPRSVHLIAIGEAGVPALHAAALEPNMFASLRIEKALSSWVEVVAAPEAKHQLENTVHAALRFYDLPDLLAALPKEQATVVDPRKP